MNLANRHLHELRAQLRHTRDEARTVRGDLSSIGSDLRELVRLEADLVRAESEEATIHAAKAITLGVIGGLFGLLALVFLFVGIMLGLDVFLPVWAAAFITALVGLAVMAVLVLLARNQMKLFSPTPSRWMSTMTEDLRWVRSQLKLNVK